MERLMEKESSFGQTKQCMRYIYIHHRSDSALVIALYFRESLIMVI